MVMPQSIGIQAGRLLTSYQGLAERVGLGFTSLGSSTVWPSANAALYRRVYNPRSWQPSHAFVVNGAAVAGNVDIGVYNVAGEQLANTGATAQAGTSAPQFIAFTEELPEGELIIALSLSDGATATVLAQTLAMVRFLEAAEEAAAHPLPAGATFADPSNFAAVLPLFGFVDRMY